MKFCSRKVLEYLKNPKDMLVATMRNWRYKRDQRVVLRDCKGRIIGYGIVAEVAPADGEELRKWLPYSGFSSVEEWVETLSYRFLYQTMSFYTSQKRL